MNSPVAQLAEPLLLPGADLRSAAAVRAAARLMSRLENEPHRLPDLYRAAAARGVDADRLHPGALIGVTGAPGSGKSTLTDALVSEYRRRFPDRRIGVVAVDPSSPFTGGAVLGDRVRMMRHATDPNVFVRSLASRGRLGGLSLGVKGVVHVLALAGCDTVFLETVGVGQSEVEVVRVADVTMVVLAPGQGDSVQMLKAGLMEAGDVFVINKADREGAQGLYAQLIATLQMGADVRSARSAAESSGDATRSSPPLRSGLNVELPIGTACHADVSQETFAELGMQARRGVEVFLVSAQEGRGVPELVEALEARRAAGAATWAGRRERAVADEVREAILEAGRARLERTLGRNGRASGAVERLLRGDATVEQLADELLNNTAQHVVGAREASTTDARRASAG